MDAKDLQTFDAALRLLKSKLRQYVYTQRQEEAEGWAQMLTLEQAILSEAGDDWNRLRGEWDLGDACARFRLSHLIGMAYHQSHIDVAAMVKDVLGDQSHILLDAYDKQIGCADLLQEQPGCNSAIS